MSSSHPEQDIPIHVKGLITDPVRGGYQILFNYESTYWRPLIGNDAWSLYEVLRSFCHNSKDEREGSCFPSINLLASILGLKERRVITGYKKTVKGKTYTYPGLIEILQQFELVIAHEVGEGPELRYEFNVVLTPKLLSPAQIKQLPSILQNKHEELLARCKENLAKIRENRRQPRVLDEKSESQTAGEEGGPVIYRGGSVIYQGGPGNLPGEFGNLPIKQQPINNNNKNNNQLTTTTDEDNNNNEISNVDENVVVALIEKGIAKRTANTLAERYSPKRIFEKIDYLNFIQQERPDEIKKPAAWLRKSIEDDYGSPDGYLSPEERESQRREADEHAKRVVEIQDAEQKKIQAQREASLSRVDALRDEEGATSSDRVFGEELKRALATTQLEGSPLRSLLPMLEFIKLDGQTATFCVTNDLFRRKLSHPGTQKIIQREIIFLKREEPAFKELKPEAIKLDFLLLDKEEGATRDPAGSQSG